LHTQIIPVSPYRGAQFCEKTTRKFEIIKAMKNLELKEISNNFESHQTGLAKKSAPESQF
jgi:hypothetical protein